jgi:hypothetical protein
MIAMRGMQRWLSLRGRNYRLSKEMMNKGDRGYTVDKMASWSLSLPEMSGTGSLVEVKVFSWRRDQLWLGDCQAARARRDILESFAYQGRK